MCFGRQFSTELRKAGMGKRKRVIGATREAVAAAEQALGVRLPPPFVGWLLKHNGTGDIFPIPDEREPRTLTGNMLDEREGLRDFVKDCEGDLGVVVDLVPIAPVGNGDFYCLDFTNAAKGDVPVVLFSHETLEKEWRSDGFVEFVAGRASGEFDDD
jgi:hypothetical protein